MDKAILRAMKAFEKEENKYKFNNPKKKYRGRKRGCIAWNKGITGYQKGDR